MVGGTSIDPANVVAGGKKVLDMELEPILRLKECVLGIREKVKSGTSPITVIGADVQHVTRREAKALEDGEEDGGAVIWRRKIVEADEAKTQRAKQGLNEGFHGMNKVSIERSA